MNDDLRAEILAKTGAERDNYIRELRRMSDSWLERENNMARNRRVLRDMDLNQVTTLLGMKRPGKTSGKKPKRKKAKAEGDDWSSDNDSENDDSEGEGEGEEEGEPAKERPPPTTRARAVRGGAKWAENAESILLEVEMGDPWEQVVGRWWTLEKRWKFVSSVSDGSTG